jgi:hypothetical protein
MGAKLSAALFNKETDFIRQQLAKTPQLAPAHSILLHSSPTLMCLFSDDARVIKVMEAADKHRPYAPKSSYNRSRGYKPREVGAVTSTYIHQGHKPNQCQTAKDAKSPAKKSGNPKSPLIEARRPQVPRLSEVPVRAISGAVPGTG